MIMRKVLIVLALLFSVSATQAQYNEQVARDDYAQAFTGVSNDFAWSRECVTDKDRGSLILEITKRIKVTTVIDTIVIGSIDDLHLGVNATLANGRLPWDNSAIKADVTYTFTSNGYIVTVSQIKYKMNNESTYSDVGSIIYNNKGLLRKRGDGDLRYLDNAFCDNLLIE